MSNEIKVNLTGELYDVFDVETAEVANLAPTEPSDSTFNAINIIAVAIHDNAIKKGFWDKDNNIAEKLMLIVSEAGEACEADRKNKHAILSMIEKSFSENNEAFDEYIKDTFEDELADIVIRTLDLAVGMGINIGAHIKAKMNYNRNRERLHGKRY